MLEPSCSPYNIAEKSSTYLAHISVFFGPNSFPFGVVWCSRGGGGGGGGRHRLIKVTGPTLRFLPRSVQQLKILPKAETDPFLHPTVDMMLHFDSLRVDK